MFAGELRTGLHMCLLEQRDLAELQLIKAIDDEFKKRIALSACFFLSAFPTVFSSSLVHHELVANYSHLFWVKGSQPELVPYMLLAHIDVVPASESDGWEAPPFSAKEIDGFIYGRGTIDDKNNLMV